MLPPNSFPLGQVLRFHEQRIIQLEQQKEESKSDLLESKFAILSERMDALTKLCNKLNAKLESNESEEEEINQERSNKALERAKSRLKDKLMNQTRANLALKKAVNRLKVFNR